MIIRLTAGGTGKCFTMTIDRIAVKQNAKEIIRTSKPSLITAGLIFTLLAVLINFLSLRLTGVAYDDIALSDCQTGQIDLGKLSLENVSSISLVVGLDDKIFVPARLFSYSSILKINTINMIPEKPFTFRVGGTVGMYGLYALQAGVTHKVVSKKRNDRLFFWNLSADAMRSKGNYPYTLHYGGVHDSVSHDIRKNEFCGNSKFPEDLSSVGLSILNAAAGPANSLIDVVNSHFLPPSLMDL